jgi:aspartate/methionine/tyrosine aminotransferase
MERIGTETAFEAAARARALEATGREVIHLEIGEPDFDTPRHISEAAAAGSVTGPLSQPGRPTPARGRPAR